MKYITYNRFVMFCKIRRFHFPNVFNFTEAMEQEIFKTKKAYVQNRVNQLRMLKYYLLLLIP